MKASDVAKLVGGSFDGANDPELTGVAALDRAAANELSFVAHTKYLRYLEQSTAGAILVTETLIPRGSTQLPRIVVQDVHRALAQVLNHFHPDERLQPGIHPTAVIGRNVQLGKGARVGAYCVIGDECAIGDNSWLYPHVTLYSNVRLGTRCIIHSGVRIGSDGFGYVFVDGEHQKVPQVGSVVIGDNVEIGANTTIDRGSVGATEIGDGVKIDNLVHIGHNVRIGDLSVIVAQVGISGSTTIGKGVTIGGQAGINGHINIGDGAVIAGQAGVFSDVPAGATYSGYPARPHKEALRAQAALFRLPALLKRLRVREE
ncbi:MAG TPA: UDP-3-O-(3-hydroxymyristoyl)glucosamine N-acyltransferase [Longimicrobiales bacterium]|nr:UDP-3-O-(3-hydroxymyristoyl)glucosamine N-acyltransferase [Longimicrobiales bacterium]